MKVRNTREGSGSGVRKWCLMRYDEKLRQMVTIQSKRFNMAQVCRDIGLDRANYEAWRTGRSPRSVTQYDLYRLCKKLNLEVSVKIELKDEA